LTRPEAARAYHGETFDNNYRDWVAGLLLQYINPDGTCTTNGMRRSLALRGLQTALIAGHTDAT
jgi:hypothetical protein